MRISQLAKLTNCPLETIRYYEKNGLLEEPPRTASGYREYQKEHLEQLLFIRHCRSLQMGLQEIRELLCLKKQPKSRCQQVDIMLEQQIERVREQMQALQALEEQLILLRRSCYEPRLIEECGILQGLEKSSPQ